MKKFTGRILGLFILVIILQASEELFATEQRGIPTIQQDQKVATSTAPTPTSSKSPGFSCCSSRQTVTGTRELTTPATIPSTSTSGSRPSDRLKQDKAEVEGIINPDGKDVPYPTDSKGNLIPWLPDEVKQDPKAGWAYIDKKAAEEGMDRDEYIEYRRRQEMGRKGKNW